MASSMQLRPTSVRSRMRTTIGPRVAPGRSGRPTEDMTTRSRLRALFICGSVNQTTQLLAIARELRELEAAFTPYYGDIWCSLARRAGLLEATIGGNKRRAW